jgi:hypothetical protein
MYHNTTTIILINVHLFILTNHENSILNGRDDGATVARSTPDRKVACVSKRAVANQYFSLIFSKSNHVRLIIS